MTVLAPYDGSALSATALSRANEFAEHRDEPLLALTVAPDDEQFAIDRGWVDPGDPYDVADLRHRFAAEVAALASAADFRFEHPTTDATSMRASVTDRVAATIRATAHDVGASIVFVGSDNAGRVWSPERSVGSPVSADTEYDVHIVRQVD